MATVPYPLTGQKSQLRWPHGWQILLAGLILVITAILVLSLPLPYQPPTQLRPARSYTEAITRWGGLEAQEEGLALYPGCESQLMTHGQKVEQVIVLLHGYRNCPSQFHQLGLRFYERGYNVIIPRMPHHGLADVLTTDQAQLSADELAAHATEAVDIAQGLGEQVTVAGISTGGVLTGWVAQNRTDIKQAVLIAPVFGLRAIPAQLTTPVTNLFTILPNFFLWQDDKLQTNVPNGPQVYPQNATRAISQILRLGSVVLTEASQSPPAATTILVVTNAYDEAVDNRITSEMVTNWRRHGFEHLQTYEFEAELHLDHDLIDPLHPKQKIDLVYPVLMDLITR